MLPRPELPHHGTLPLMVFLSNYLKCDYRFLDSRGIEDRLPDTDVIREILCFQFFAEFFSPEPRSGM